MLARIGIIGLAILVGCRTPTSEQGQLGTVSIDDSRRTSVQVVVTSMDEDLRLLVASSLSLQLRQASLIVPVAQGGRLLLHVDVTMQAPSSAAEGESVHFAIRVVDRDASERSLTDGQGHPTDSILGGTLTCRVDEVWSTCFRVVLDVNQYVRMEQEQLRALLRDGETDLVDDEAVRQGAR